MAKVTMPQLGESVAEGTIGRWLKQPGDAVAQYEPLLEVITDKVNAEVPSPYAGTLREILAPEGAVVPNNAEIAIIDTAGEAAEADAGGASAARTAAAAVTGTAPAASPPLSAAPSTPAEEAGDPTARMTPAVRRLLREHNLAPSQVPGTGGGGRITREDVLARI